MDVVLHAGCYKTATSSIQLIANMKRDDLAADGILFPLAGLRRNEGSNNTLSRAHHSLFHKVKGANETQGLVAQLQEELAAVEGLARVFLSTELLAGTDIDLKRRFLDSYAPLGSFRIEYAIRAPDEYAESINNQMRKSGRVNRQFGRLPYRDDISHWTELLGREAVRLSYFAKGNARGFIDAFYARLGASGRMYIEGLDDNPAVSVKGMLVREALMQMFHETGPHDRRTRQRTMNAIRDFDAGVLSDSPKAITLTPEDRADILRQYRDDMEALAELLSPEERAQMREELDPKKLARAPRKNIDDPIALSSAELIGFARLAGELGLVGARGEAAVETAAETQDDGED